MKTDNTMVYIIAAVVIAHFAIGIGLLIYKMSTPSKKKSEE